MNMRTTIGAAFLALSGTAYGMHCPVQMRQIDEALARNPKLGDVQMSEVKKYRADGEALHKAGKHQASMDTLGKALKILDVRQ
jgi:hypothetical protein